MIAVVQANDYPKMMLDVVANLDGNPEFLFRFKSELSADPQIAEAVCYPTATYTALTYKCGTRGLYFSMRTDVDTVV